MTRKDYILLANVLRVARNNASPAAKDDLSLFAIDQLANDLCCELKRDNARFNREHFLAVVRGEKDLQSRPLRRTVREHVISASSGLCIHCGADQDDILIGNAKCTIRKAVQS